MFMCQLIDVQNMALHFDINEINLITCYCAPTAL